MMSTGDAESNLICSEPRLQNGRDRMIQVNEEECFTRFVASTVEMYAENMPNAFLPRKYEDILDFICEILICKVTHSRVMHTRRDKASDEEWSIHGGQGLLAAACYYNFGSLSSSFV